jgi:glyoxylase-like metal-dependent hydrolase (beta-lactamase superfamily II)
VSVLVEGGPTRASSVVARCGADVAIFDTGMAMHANSLVAALASQGLVTDDVTLVFNTHAHLDHSHNNVLFPRATIYASALDRAWTFALHDVLARNDSASVQHIEPFYPHVAAGRYRPKVVQKVLAIEKLLWDPSRLGPALRTRWLEEVDPPAGITVVPTPGHVPHHVSFAIATQDRPVLVCGDALLIRASDDSANWLMPPSSIEEYRRSQRLVEAFDGIIVPGHDEPFDNRPTAKAMAAELRR